MMLDTATLRVALAVVDLTLLLLFYFITFRRTRSAYSGWWCMALLLFLSGNAAYLLDGTPYQVWSNPLGNVFLVGGAASIWAGARSLRTTTPKIWYLAAAPGITAVASVLDQPATNVWSGTSLVTTELLPTIASLPMVTPFMIEHPKPIQAPSLM